LIIIILQGQIQVSV